MADPVVIKDYHPTWPCRFDSEREQLLNAGGRWVVDIQHIGSTAVPGLAAKPVIDIAVAIADDDCLDTDAEMEAIPGEYCAIEPAGNSEHVDLVHAIRACGFVYRGVNGLPGRLFFFRHIRDRSAHVHVVRQESWFWCDQLLFRDWLRTHPNDAAAYERLKRDLSSRLGDDRVAYTDAKSEFIRSVLLRAGGCGPWLRES